jgi:hypothetical protein
MAPPEGRPCTQKPMSEEHFGDSRPVHGKQDHIGFLDGLARCAGPSLAAGLPRERAELPLVRA